MEEQTDKVIVVDMDDRVVILRINIGYPGPEAVCDLIDICRNPRDCDPTVIQPLSVGLCGFWKETAKDLVDHCHCSSIDEELSSLLHQHCVSKISF